MWNTPTSHYMWSWRCFYGVSWRHDILPWRLIRCSRVYNSISVFMYIVEELTWESRKKALSSILKYQSISSGDWLVSFILTSGIDVAICFGAYFHFMNPIRVSAAAWWRLCLICRHCQICKLCLIRRLCSIYSGCLLCVCLSRCSVCFTSSVLALGMFCVLIWSELFGPGGAGYISTLRPHLIIAWRSHLAIKLVTCMQSAKDVDRSSSLADCITDFIARTFLQHSRNSLVYVTVRLYDVVSRTSECLLFENLGTTSPFLPIVYIHLQPHYHASSSSGPMLSHDQKSTNMAGTTQAPAS